VQINTADANLQPNPQWCGRKVIWTWIMSYLLHALSQETNGAYKRNYKT